MRQAGHMPPLFAVLGGDESDVLCRVLSECRAVDLCRLEIASRSFSRCLLEEAAKGALQTRFTGMGEERAAQRLEEAKQMQNAILVHASTVVDMPLADAVEEVAVLNFGVYIKGLLTEFKEDMLDDRKVVLCRTAWSQALRPLVGEFYSQSHLTLPAAASHREGESLRRLLSNCERSAAFFRGAQAADLHELDRIIEELDSQYFDYGKRLDALFAFAAVQARIEIRDDGQRSRQGCGGQDGGAQATSREEASPRAERGRWQRGCDSTIEAAARRRARADSNTDDAA